MKSWKTTAMAIIALVIACLQGFVAFIDDDAATSPNWTLIGTTLMTTIGLLFARDNNVTSESAGAK